MLAMLQRCVEEKGGNYAFCATDSMAVVATWNGGRLESNETYALSGSEVDEIIAKFASVNPYDRSVVPASILKVEKKNSQDGRRAQLYAYCISAKRYALFTRNRQGRLFLKKVSEHGLGHLLNPLDPDAEPVKGENEEAPRWLMTIWELIIRRELAEAPSLPEWIHRPALSRQCYEIRNHTTVE